MLTLALTRDIGRPFGWGICSLNLARELSQKTDARILPLDQPAGRIDGKVLHAIADLHFRPSIDVAGDYNAGYCFFENNLTFDSIRNARSYDHIFCGSTFNKKLLALYDVFHTSVLIQGVDHNIFNAEPPRKPDDKFYIFSGGKFEYRKGQDLVIAAFKALMDKYKDMHLVTLWENMWPQSAATMQHSQHIVLNVQGENWQERMKSLCDANGIPPDRVTHHPISSQEEISKIIANTDLGIFPNRCEGGTNLALMEYMAKQRPVIASYNTGHKDILNQNGINAILLHNQKVRELKPYTGYDYTAYWCEPDINELIAHFEWAYLHRDELNTLGAAATKTMQPFTWGASADYVLDQIMDPEVDKPDYLPHRYMLGSMLTRMGYDGEGAEIGVYSGTLSGFIYSRWLGANQPQEEQDKLYELVKEMFEDCEDVNIIRDESLNAVKQFEDGQLDWVYIDADHSYDAVKADIEAWFPKVRIGGLVSGDDYFDGTLEIGEFGVKSVVDEFVAKHGYELKFEATKNKLPSWYFVKDH
ncbi:MAG: class I SAM-dependent methyltransferase [Candidatus Thorarchaeota archaeon]|jgi:glycosyltransferase involved in cell wall biosynthesis